LPVTAAQTPNTETTYPNAQIDPRQKGYDWILQYVKAAYRDNRGFMPLSFLNNGILKTSEIMMYAMGKQPVDKYKKMFSPGNPDDQSWRAIDWTPLGLMCQYRNMALSLISQKRYDIKAFAIDPLAKSEEDAIYNEMKVKVMMRQAAESQGSDLASHAMLQPQPGEAQDLEQLEMQKNYGFKHEMALVAENAINLVLQQNNCEQLYREIDQQSYDYGIAGLANDIDENGMVKTRAINREYLGLSYCEKQDFSDLVHWFEIIPTYVADLAPYYTKDQLDDICKKSLNKNGNPVQYFPTNGYFNQAWNRFKVYVMKIKFLSWNDTVYKDDIDRSGNEVFQKSHYENRQFLSVSEQGELKDDKTAEEDFFAPLTETGEQGQPTPKYINSTKKVAYKAAWVVDTDYMHDYGLKENQNRKLSSWWDTDLDVYLFSWNFYRMQWTGVTERLISLEDRACMIWYNLQNLSNKLIPYLINIDFNAVEAVNFGKTGQKQKPSEIMDFIFSNYVVPYRSTNLLSRNPNYKPMSIEATGQLAAFGELYDQLEAVKNLMRQVSGLNELTDGSTPNSNTLVSVAKAAIESTNNSIYLLCEGKKDIIRRAADGIVQKVQIAVKLGKVEGYAKALGSNSVDFFSINPDISLHELGIFIDEAPTQAEREALWSDLNMKESQGLVTVGDKYFIMSCRNLDEAIQVLDYKIEKRKEQQQQFALQQTQSQAQANSQVAQVTEQMKQQSIQLQMQADLTTINAQMQWQYRIEAMKKQSDVSGEQLQADARTIGHQIQSEAKIEAAKISAHSTLASKHIDSFSHLSGKQIDAETAIEKQHIANKKSNNSN
jgi:hypothetical protein